MSSATPLPYNVRYNADSGTLQYEFATGWINVPSQSSATAWGSITGTLSAQTDLQTALNAKATIGSNPAFNSVVTSLINSGGDLTLQVPADSSVIVSPDGTTNYVNMFLHPNGSIVRFDIGNDASSISGSLSLLQFGVLNFGDTNNHTMQLGIPTLAADYNLTFPTNQGAANTTLVNDGSGALSWASGSSAPNVVQQSNASGTSEFTGNSGFHDTTSTVTITASATGAKLLITATGTIRVTNPNSYTTYAVVDIKKDGTSLTGGAGITSVVDALGTFSTQTFPVSLSYVDTAANTSAHTYTVAIVVTAGASTGLTVSWNNSNTPNLHAIMIAQEIK